MATQPNETAEQPRASKRFVSYRNKIAAARLRVSVDKKLGVETPGWIRELAKKSA